MLAGVRMARRSKKGVEERNLFLSGSMADINMPKKRKNE